MRKSVNLENNSDIHQGQPANINNLLKKACKGRCHLNNLNVSMEREKICKKRLLRES